MAWLTYRSSHVVSASFFSPFVQSMPLTLPFSVPRFYYPLPLLSLHWYWNVVSTATRHGLLAIEHL